MVLRVPLEPQVLKVPEVQMGRLALKAQQELRELPALKGHKAWQEPRVRMVKMGQVLTKWRSVRVLWVQNPSGWPRLLDLRV